MQQSLHAWSVRGTVLNACAHRSRVLLNHSRPSRQLRQARRVAHAAAAAGGGAAWDIQQSGSRKEWQRDDLHVVLVHPNIPQNAGSVARTCAATSVALHLVRPLGFEIDSAKLKRAGLDYWPFVVVKVHDDWSSFRDFFREQGRGRLVAFSKFGDRKYTTPGTYHKGDWIMFGAETSGLPPEAHEAAEHIVKIPMGEQHVRSLNLAVSVGVGLYEAIRQIDGDE